MSRRGSDSTMVPTNAINTIAGSISSTGVVNMPKSTVLTRLTLKATVIKYSVLFAGAMTKN